MQVFYKPTIAYKFWLGIGLTHARQKKKLSSFIKYIFFSFSKLTIQNHNLSKPSAILSNIGMIAWFFLFPSFILFLSLFLFYSFLKFLFIPLIEQRKYSLVYKKYRRHGWIYCENSLSYCNGQSLAFSHPGLQLSRFLCLLAEMMSHMFSLSPSISISIYMLPFPEWLGVIFTIVYFYLFT